MSLARKMLLGALLVTALLLYNSFLITGEIANALNALKALNALILKH